VQNATAWTHAHRLEFPPLYLVILFTSLLVFTGVTLAFVNSRAFSMFHPFTIYLLFHGLVFVFRPFLSYWLEYNAIYRAFRFTPSPSDKITVIVAATLGLLTFGFFCFRHGFVAMRFRHDAPVQAERDRSVRKFIVVMVLCGPIAVWSLLSLYGAASNFDTLGTMGRDKATGVIYNTTGNGYFAEAQMMLVPLTAVFAWLCRFRLVALLPLGAFVLGRAATGGRGPFVAAMLAAGLLFLYDQRRRFPTLRFTMVLAAGALAFTAIGSDRGQSVRGFFGEQTDSRLVSSYDYRFMEGMDFANLEFFEYLVYVIPQRSHTYGYFNDVLQVFTEPVPRVLWKNKPFGAPFERFSLFDYGYPTGATRSLPGNGWYALGWLGVIINCGVWGYVLGLLYRRFVESDQSVVKVAAYLVFLPILVVAYRDGSPVTVFRQGIFFMFPILLWVFLGQRTALRPALSSRNSGSAPVQTRRASGLTTELPAAVVRRRNRLEAQRRAAGTRT